MIVSVTPELKEPRRFIQVNASKILHFPVFSEKR